MKFQFIGDAEGHGPESITLFGYTFDKGGEFVDVEGEAAEKLATNGHFVTDGGKSEGGLSSLSKDELEALGREHGIELDKRRKKADLVQQVQEAIDAHSDTTSD